MLNVDLFRRLCEVPGIPGREHRVRELIAKETKGLFDSSEVDAMGSLICTRKATRKSKKKPVRVMLAAHMDEIGFFVRHVDENGMIWVNPAGGFDTRNLFAARVKVCTPNGDFHGVMNPGGKPIHISSEAERTKVPGVEEFFIDLGRDAKDVQGAFDLLGEALAKAPDTPELLYDQALLAERLGRFDVTEKNLARVIEIQPDHAHAHNALGYSLADRNVRLDEALKLIQTAVKLAPDDPYIMDSLGWVFFRMGNAARALDILQQAYKLKRDAEIAAHLGEVLWTQGQRDEARRIWDEALKASPDNEVLQGTVKRLRK